MHDFKRFPELTDNQMSFYYWDSPHKQITGDFRARVVGVHDGDTIKVMWDEREFPFTVRLSDISAPEPKEPGGIAGRVWLADRILGEEVDVLINPDNRVDKWGRILGNIMWRGMSMNDEIVRAGKAVPWAERHEVIMPDFNKELKEIWN